MSFAKSAEKEIAERQKELELLKQAKGDDAFVPSGMEDAAAQQVVRDKAARLEWQMDKVQQQMKKMKQQAGALEDQWEEKVAAAKQECEEAKASLATATSSGSVHTDVWDGSANTRGKHLLAIKAAGEPSLNTLLHDLNEAKVRAEERGPMGKMSMADMCGFLSTLHMRQGLMADEATRRQVVLSPDEAKEVERSPLGAEVLFWVLEVYDEGGNPETPPGSRWLRLCSRRWPRTGQTGMGL